MYIFSKGLSSLYLLRLYFYQAELCLLHMEQVPIGAVIAPQGLFQCILL